MALFKVNTGNREEEVRILRWEWEIAVPELKTSVFVTPGRERRGQANRDEPGGKERDRSTARDSSQVRV